MNSERGEEGQDVPEIDRLRHQVAALGEEVARLRSDLMSGGGAAAVRHAALLAAIPDIVMEVDANKVYTWANPAGLEFFGTDVLGREAATYFEGEQDTYRQVQPLFRGEEEVFYVESWQRRQDGEKRLLAWWCHVLKDETGQVTGALSTARDVTDERLVAAALREAEERFRSFYDNAPIGKSMTSPDGRLLRVNPAFAAMLDYTVEELQATTFAAITHADDLPESRECVRSLLAGDRERWSMEKRFLAKGGRPVWTHVITRLHRDSQGHPIFFLTHIQDITARKHLEEELRRHQERLEELVAEKTAELARVNASLRESEQRLTRETAVVAAIVSEMLSGDLTDAEAERLVLDACLEATGCAHGMIGAIDPQGGFTVTTYPDRALGDCAFPQGQIQELSTGMKIRGIWGWPLIHGEPLLCNDLLEHPDRVGQPEGHLPIHSFLGVPIRREGAVTGMVALANKTGGFTLEDQRTLTRLVEVLVVSQRHRLLLAERQASELRYRRLFEAAKDGILILDAQSGRIVDVNPYLTELTGYSADDFLGRQLWELGSFRDIADSREAFANLQAEKYVRYDHLPLEARDGKKIDVEFVSNVYRVGDKDVIQCNIRDISGRRRAEEALRAEEEKYRLLAENTLDVIWTLGPDFEFTYVNPAIARLTGHTPEQWIGSKLSDHVEQAAFDELRKMLVAEGSKGPGREGAVFETSLLGVDGRPVPVEVHARVLLDEQGVLKGVQGVSRDITERRELHAQLAQADRLSTMGTLAAGIAHEINNPLSYVLYNVQSLSEDLPRLEESMRRCYVELCSRMGTEAASALLGGDDAFGPAMFEDLSARFRDALAGTLRIKDIARGLGTFSRVDRADVAPVNVHHAVEQAINMAYNQIKYRARLVKDFGQVPLVLGSDGKLAQVFLNLLINAAHAIEEGHVEQNEIRVRTWVEGEQICAEVSDTGGGIAHELQAKIFDPFFTTKGVGVGTGLGLSICRNIVRGFGGEIAFTSEVGRGTRFLVRLPRVPVGWESQGQAPPEPAPLQTRLRGRILVVDDEAGIRSIVTRLLGKEHEVIALSSGEEAKALLATDSSFDLIFCDLMMPQLSGMELHAWIASHDPRLAEQVVFITGGAFTPGAAEYLRQVPNLRIEKPFDAAAFKKTTEELVLAAWAKKKA